MKGLQYSEGAAYRRISAMRLLRDVPAIEQKLVSGSLTVTAASKLQGALTMARRHDKKTFSVEQKAALVEKLAGKPSLECDRVLAAEVCKTVAHHDNVRAVCSLLKLMAMVVLDKIDPGKDHSGTKASLDKPELLAPTTPQERPHTNPPKPTKRVALPPLTEVPRYIPVHVKREVWSRDKGECGYVDPKTGKKCGARWGLEYDHCHPFALEGEATVENLRLRCRTHNLLHAREMGLARSG